jgi:hypothetical protein
MARVLLMMLAVAVAAAAVVLVVKAVVPVVVVVLRLRSNWRHPFLRLQWSHTHHLLVEKAAVLPAEMLAVMVMMLA